MGLVQDAISIAISQLHKTENPLGSNWGEPVRSYLKSVGIDFPAAWCCAYVFWCFNEAAKKNNVPNPLVKTGGVLRLWNESKKYRVVGEPKAGDVFIMDFGKGLGHTGIVLKTDANFIYTIEGNTNDSGSREGIAVCNKQRPKKKIKGYLRYK